MPTKYDWWKDNTYETPSLARERWEEIRCRLIDGLEVTDYELREFLKLASYPDLRDK